MDVTITISNAEESIIEPIKAFLKQISPKSSLSVERLYPAEASQKTAEELAIEERRAKVDALCGGLSQYANPKLRKKEKDAWAMAVMEKYGVS